MNVHDSERLSGLLESAGYVAYDGEDPLVAGDQTVVPDLIVFNTCAVRENAAQRLYGTLGQLLGVKEDHPSMQIAVGGCQAQNDGKRIVEKAPWVDVAVSYTHLTLPTILLV